MKVKRSQIWRVWVWLLLAIAVTARGATPPDRFKNFQPVFVDGNLIVAAAIATDAPYKADPTGTADASDAIQRAMGDVSAHGGGTVYLPSGRYRIAKPLSMPATVTLCGEWRKPQPGQPLSGTILLACAGKGDANGKALISSPECGHADIYNLTIYYPEQDPANPVPYPFSIDGRVSYVHGITLVNSYQGIMMSGFSGSSVTDIYGTVLKRGIVLKSSCELCSCYHLRLNSDYWTQLPEAKMTAENAAKVRNDISSELVGIQIGKVDGLSFYDADLAEARTPVLVKLEDDEQKVMIAPRSQYGFGGGLAKVHGARTEVEGAWYFGTHYFDLDNYPQLTGKNYPFAPMRRPERADLTYQSTDSGVKADGVTDDSAALQKALDHAAKAGGGTVLLPRGITFLGAPITVPPGVELRGGVLGVVVRPWYTVSALIIGFGADSLNPDNARAAISLQERAGLRGVCIFHSKNQWETNARGEFVIHPYPYAIRGLGREVYLHDVTLSNAYNGIDLGKVRCDRAQLVNLWGAMFHHGIRIGAGSDSVQLQNINIDVGALRDMHPADNPKVTEAQKQQAWAKYLSNNAVDFVIEDCTNLKTFHLAGFAPHRFMEFVDQGTGGCRDAKFWSTIFDVPQVEMARFRSGGTIDFYGLFATGGGNHSSHWCEFDPSFNGIVNAYGLTQQLTFNNGPYPYGPDKLRIYLEHSLTTGRPATASSSIPGSGPEKALDGDPRTIWQSKDETGVHLLTVKLAGPTIVTRWRVHNAGNYMPQRYDTANAALEGSMNGTNYVKLAEFTNNTQDWVDNPVKSETPVRYVRLKITKPQQDPQQDKCARIAAFDVFGHPAK